MREVAVPAILGVAGAGVGRVSASFVKVLERLGQGARDDFTVTRTARAIFASRENEGGSRHNETLFVSDARLENRQELGALLSLRASELTDQADGSLLRQLWQELGPRGISQALGAFAFAAWDEAAQRLTLGRDCLGRRPLFFYRGDGFVAFASDLSVLLSLPFVPKAIDEDAMANYLAENLSRPFQTHYRGIERVPSRTLVTIDSGGIQRRHYWSADIDAPPLYRREEDYIERARELLDQAVRRATTDTPRVAIMTSGGLDSSAVAATAARLGKAQSIACYTVVPPSHLTLELGRDWYLSEREKVEALARMYPTLDVQFYEEGELYSLEKNPVRRFVELATPFLYPTQNGAYAGAQRKLIADGHRICFTGGMGNLGLSWRGGFSLVAALQKGKIATFVRESRAIARQTGRSAARTFVQEVVARAAPLWLLRQLHRLRGADPDDVSSYSPLRPDIARELSRSGAWSRDGYEPHFRATGGNAAKLRARYMFDHNQFGRDANASTAKLYGFETRDPLADRTLLEFLLRVPESMYRQNGIGRSFARKVLADRLPPVILDDQRLGAQDVTWFQRLDLQRMEFAQDIERIGASPLASRLIDVPRLKRILDTWPKDAQSAQARRYEVQIVFARGIHTGRFIRWVEGGNA